MKRLASLFYLLSALCVLGSSKPNIVLILADDMGYGDVQALNPDSKIPTPHLDRLAREGSTFVEHGLRQVMENVFGGLLEAVVA